MATVYSLLCWGGKNGKTATMTIASPCVVTITKHGLRSGMAVRFSTTGTLPTGVTAGTTYYINRQGNDTFWLYSTSSADAIAGGATGRVNTSGSQSGTHTAKGEYYSALTDKTRWTVNSVEYIFDSISAWNTYHTTTNPASAFDIHTLEIGEGFTDWYTTAASLALTIPSAGNKVVSSVDSVRTGAFHGGVYPSFPQVLADGFMLYSNSTVGSDYLLKLNRYRDEVDGIILCYQQTFGMSGLIGLLQPQCRAANNFCIGNFGGTGAGIGWTGVICTVENNIAVGLATGYGVGSFVPGCIIANNIAAKNTTGFNCTVNSQGFWYNNISVGNTTNWVTTSNIFEGASNNAGESGNNPWGTNDITVATTDFVDYTNNDFRPAAITSPQVESGINFYGAADSDLEDNFRPGYSGSSYNTAVTAGSFVSGLSYTIATIGTTDFTAVGAVSNAVTFTDSGDTVGWTGHPLLNNDPVYFSSITTTTGISTNTLYYVVNKAANTFQVATTPGGTALALTTNGTGTVVVGLFKASGVSVTFTDAGDLVNWTAHPLSAGDPVYFSSITTTTGITKNVEYYVVNPTANNFQVAATVGGSALTLTTDGSGVIVTTYGVGTGTGTATLGAVYDVGPFEYDLGYGAWPATRDLDLSGIVAGSQVVVYTTGTQTVLAQDDNTGTTFNYAAGATGVTVDYTVMRLGYDPIRVTGVALDAESTALTVQQKPNRAWVASSGLTYSTDLLFTAGSPNTLKLRIASTLQNAMCLLYEAFIDSSTYTALRNVEFPVASFGDTGFTLINGCEWRGWSTAGTAISNSSLDLLTRDGLRYSSDNGVTTTAQWAAILTLDAPAGIQVKYRQATAGTITNAANTGPMDQLVQVYGNASYGNFDYRGHMVLRAPKPGYTQPQPDLVAIYGNLADGLYVTGLEPILQWTTTNATVDAANMTFNNTTKATTVTATHTMLELHQEAQYWANLDAQWDADIPLYTTDGSTFIQPSNWSVTGVAYLSGGTLSGGSATLAAGVQGISYGAITLNLGAAGTYTFDTTGSVTIKMTPTAPGTYALADGAFIGTLDLRNESGTHAITVEVPSGTTTTTANNTGAAITVVVPAVTADISITSMPDAVGAYNRLQIINQTALTAATRANSTAYSLGDIRLRQTGIGTENTAGLYLRCTTAGTSAGSPPVWNTTPGGTTTDGTVVWTTYAVLYYDADPASTSYTDSYIDGEEFLAGETAEIRFAEMNGGTSFKVYDTTAIVATSGFTVAVNEEANGPFATIGVDGTTQEATFSPNYTNDRLVLDSNTDFAGVGGFAYYCYLLTTSEGMYNFWGGVTALDEANFRINTAILDMYFDETNGFVKQTDNVRWFRDDGLRPALDPTTGGSGIEINWRVPVNVVTTGGSALTPTESAHLLALSNAPSAATVADAVHDEVVEGTTTLRQSIRLHNAVLLGKVSGGGTGTETFRDIGDTKDRVVSVNDSSGNRTSVTLDGT